MASPLWRFWRVNIGAGWRVKSELEVSSMARALTLVLALVLLAGTAASAERLPRPYAEELAREFWGSSPRSTEIGAAYRRFVRYTKTGDWGRAVQLGQKLSPRVPKSGDAENPALWTVALAELDLYALRLDAAERRLRKVLEENGFRPIRPDEQPGESWPLQSACYAMSDVKARRGQFRQARWWLTQAKRAMWTGCGNFAGSLHNWEYPLHLIWARAQLPYEEAVAALEPIMAGVFQTNVLIDLDREAGRDERQIEHAAAEATLVLAELHLRNGNRGLARATLLRAAESRYPSAHVARAYLKRMAAQGREAKYRQSVSR